MARHDDPATQAAHEAWNQSVLDQADHRIDCSDGCTIMGDVCEIGKAYAAIEQSRWREFHDARFQEVAV